MDLGAQDQQKNPKSKGLQWDLRTLELDLRFRGGLGLSPIGLENFKGGLSPSPSPTSAIASLDLDLDLGDLSGVSGWAPHATSAQVPLVKAKSAEAQPLGT